MRASNDLIKTVSLALTSTFAIVVIGAAFLQRDTPVHVAALAGRTSLRFSERAQRQTVYVETEHGSGSGIVVKRHNALDRVFVWTAAHVVADTDTAKVRLFFRREGAKAGEAVFEARVILRPAGVDAALLQVSADPDFFVASEFDFVTPRVGTRTLHVGNILGRAFDGSVTSGIVSQIGVKPDMEGWPWRLVDQTTALIIPGSSGGPIFNAENEKVLGIAVGWPQIPGISLYVPVRELVKAVGRLDWTLRGDVCPDDALLDWMATQAKLPPKVDILKLLLGPLAPDSVKPQAPPEPAPKKKIGQHRS